MKQELIIRHSSVLKDSLEALVLAVGVSLAVGTGPMLQEHLAALLSGNAASVYDSRYEDGISAFMTFGAWIEQSIGLVSTASGLAIALSAIAAPSMRHALLRSCTAAFLMLCSFDLYFTLVDESSTISGLIESVIANAVAAPFIAILTTAGTKIIRSGGRSASLDGLSSTTLLLTPVFLGVLVNGAIYAALRTLYQAHPVEAHITLPPPYSFTTRVHDKPAELGTKSFAVLSRAHEIDGFIEITAPEKGPSIRTMGEWPDGSRVVIEAWTGCLPRDLDMILDAEREPLLDEPLGTLSIAGDSGSSAFGIAPKTSGVMFIDSTDEEIQQASIRIEDDELQASKFVSDRSTHQFWSSDRKLALLYTPFPFRGNETTQRPSARATRMSVNGRPYSIRTDSPTDGELSQPIKCVRVPTSQQLISGVQHISADAASLSLVALISPGEDFRDFSTAKASYVEVSGLGGFMSQDPHPETDEREGTTDFLILNGNPSSVTANGETLTHNSEVTLQLLGGQLNVQQDSKGVLTVQGEAKAMFLNSQRVNRTLWESFDMGWRLALAGLVGTILLWILRLGQNLWHERQN